MIEVSALSPEDKPDFNRKVVSSQLSRRDQTAFLRLIIVDAGWCASGAGRGKEERLREYNRFCEERTKRDGYEGGNKRSREDGLRLGGQTFF